MPLDPQMFPFLAELAEHNDREWFTANKQRYDAHVKAPSLAFLEALQAPLAAVLPHVKCIPKVQGGSMFRIHRDTRFSKDKTPYKTAVAFHFSHEHDGGPGLYLHLEPGHGGVGAGCWRPDNGALKRLRDALVADTDGFRAAFDAVTAAGWSWYGDDALKRAPKGYDPEHPEVDVLKRKGWAVHKDIDPQRAVAPDFEAWLVDTFTEAAPFASWVADALEMPF